MLPLVVSILLLLCGGRAAAQLNVTGIVSPLPDMPRGRFDGAAVTILSGPGGTSELHLCGGSVASGITNSVDIFHFETETWRSSSIGTFFRYGAAASAPNFPGFGLYCGGRDPGGAQFRSVQCQFYNASSGNQWSAAPPMSDGRWLHSAEGNGDKIIMAAGFLHPSWVNSAQIYDVRAQSWENVTFPFRTARGQMGSATAGRYSYFAGGYCCSQGGPSVADVEVYDGVLDTWSAATDLAAARDYPVSVAIGSSAVFFLKGQTSTVSERYSGLTRTAYPPSSFLFDRACGVEVNGRHILIGGLGTSEAVVFDSFTASWSGESNVFSTSRNKVFCARHGNSSYFFGGQNATGATAKVERFTITDQARYTPATTATTGTTADPSGLATATTADISGLTSTASQSTAIATPTPPQNSATGGGTPPAVESTGSAGIDPGFLIGAGAGALALCVLLVGIVACLVVRRSASSRDSSSSDNVDLPVQDQELDAPVASQYQSFEAGGSKDASPDGDNYASPYATTRSKDASPDGDNYASPYATAETQYRPFESNTGSPDEQPTPQDDFDFGGYKAMPGRAVSGQESMRAENLLVGVNVGAVIGEGAFGQVFKGSYNGRTVAIKKINEGTDSEFMQELEMLCRVRSPYVVEFLGVSHLPGGEMSLVMEFCGGGSLIDVLTKTGPTIPNAGLIQCCLHTAKGLQVLHKLDIIHRDIACRNILVASDGSCKLADFGLARALEEHAGHSSSTKVYYASSPVALRWTAPETLDSSKTVKASDIYSLGVTFQEIFAFGKLPFSETCETHFRVVGAVMSGERPPYPPACSKEVFGLIERMWQQEHQNRPSIEKVVGQLEGILHEVTGSSAAYDFSRHLR